MQDENKQQNKIGELKPSTGAISMQDVSVFKDNPQLIYLYKKTEKLVSALYLLSSFISDKEPVKWQMREAGTVLLSESLSMSDRSSSVRASAYSNFISTGLKFLSFLEVSFVGGIISQMNYDILKYEFENLIQTAEATEKTISAKGVIFPNHFFEVAPEHKTHSLPSHTLNTSHVVEKTNTASVGDKGQTSSVSDRTPVKKAAESVRPSELKQKDKTNRQDIIIGLLKKNKELGIKDFVSSINGCSEKTIQRELVALVSKGQIKKEGEKRWSRYMLR